MCGIAAIFNIQGETEKFRGRALEMSRKIRHRGPDWSGIYVGKSAVLAHERLSIVDPASGGQPLFSPDGKQVTDTEAKIVDGSSFAEQLAAGHVLFIGDAADKCRTVITNPNAHFIQCCPKASSMLVPAMAEYKEKRFRDVAYFEPFYLKNFVATASRRKLF